MGRGCVKTLFETRFGGLQTLPKCRSSILEPLMRSNILVALRFLRFHTASIVSGRSGQRNNLAPVPRFARVGKPSSARTLAASRSERSRPQRGERRNLDFPGDLPIQAWWPLAAIHAHVACPCITPRVIDGHDPKLPITRGGANLPGRSVDSAAPGAQLWINHDKAQSERIPHSPAYVE